MGQPLGTPDEFDVVFVGAGPGGYVGAIRAAQNGLRTAVVDRDERPGGTCLLRGCIPTKSLLESAAVYDAVRGAGEFGIGAGEVSFDWAGVLKRKEKAVAKNAAGVKFLFRKNRVEHVVGTASLAGPGLVEVGVPDGARRTLRARHVVVATGSAVRELPLARADGRRVFTSDDILAVEAPPASLLVVGAGAVGVEFASVFARFGSRVTLLEMLPRLLPVEDEEVSAELGRCLRRRGVECLTGATITDVKVENGVQMRVELPGGPPRMLRADALLMAAGRRPVTEGLGLERFPGVSVDRGFVRTDGLMRTGEAWLSAIGDAARPGDGPHPLLAHVASAEGVLVADRLAGKHVEPLDYDQVVSATYCEPQVASVGLTEARAKERRGEVNVGRFPYAAIGKSAVTGTTEGFSKIVAAREHDELLGVHIVGALATELIHEAAVALRLESTAEELARTIHAHPTLSEGIMEAAHAAGGRPIGA